MTSCKPSFVRPKNERDDHVSGADVAADLLHATRLTRGSRARPEGRMRLLALARGGVCPAPSVTGTGGALLPHHFTLTCGRSHIGGLFSVALSLTRSPRAGGCYPPPSSCRARTFLETPEDASRSSARRPESTRRLVRSRYDSTSPCPLNRKTSPVPPGWETAWHPFSNGCSRSPPFHAPTSEAKDRRSEPLRAGSKSRIWMIPDHLRERNLRPR